MVAHEDPTSSIIFQEKFLVTSCCRGYIKLWARPFTTTVPITTTTTEVESASVASMPKE
ncbi:hypothetical protein BDF19DRAFT_450107 [Syncephalis fuscata]|nr:hypothetical protein BDF19DRAFT_450107 [Syncephalis fuscata]